MIEILLLNLLLHSASAAESPLHSPVFGEDLLPYILPFAAAREARYSLAVSKRWRAVLDDHKEDFTLQLWMNVLLDQETLAREYPDRGNTGRLSGELKAIPLRLQFFPDRVVCVPRDRPPFTLMSGLDPDGIRVRMENATEARLCRLSQSVHDLSSVTAIFPPGQERTSARTLNERREAAASGRLETLNWRLLHWFQNQPGMSALQEVTSDYIVVRGLRVCVNGQDSEWLQHVEYFWMNTSPNNSVRWQVVGGPTRVYRLGYSLDNPPQTRGTLPAVTFRADHAAVVFTIRPRGRIPPRGEEQLHPFEPTHESTWGDRRTSPRSQRVKDVPYKIELQAPVRARSRLIAWMRAIGLDPTPECAHCKAANAWKRCARCKGVHYCDRACQRRNWAEHKPDCREHDTTSCSQTSCYCNT